MPDAAAYTIAEEDPRSEDSQVLIDELNTVLRIAYTPEQNHFVDGEKLVARGACFLVARDGGGPLGCGAAAPIEGTASAEIKRMWTRPRGRRRGVARAILERLESWSRARGHDRLMLETGIHQSEARALYTALGFVPRGPFGEYPLDEASLFFEKSLTDTVRT